MYIYIGITKPLFRITWWRNKKMLTLSKMYDYENGSGHVLFRISWHPVFGNRLWWKGKVR